LGLNLAQKIIQDHLIQGEMKAGQEIALRIDHTLLHDTLGLMALLEFEAMGLPQVKTKRSVVFTDHNTLQLSPEGNDDHRFIPIHGRQVRDALLTSRKWHLPSGAVGEVQ